jgi:hypothetical protein
MNTVSNLIWLAQPLISLAATTRWGAPSFAHFAKGGIRESEVHGYGHKSHRPTNALPRKSTSLCDV